MLNLTKRVVATTDDVISFTAFQGPQPLLTQLNLTWFNQLTLSLSICPPYRLQQGVRATEIPFPLSLACNTVSRRGSTPVSTVLRKSDRFSTINISKTF